MKKFVALYDLHWGYERKGGHKVTTHDPRALDATMQFVEDFKPDSVILGGDILDCRAVSHHTKGKPGQVEGLRLVSDAKELNAELIKPIEKICKGGLSYITGNHEDWLNQLIDEYPALENIVSIEAILGLSKRWNVVPNGDMVKLGKLVFIHGDQLKGGDNPAKAAVTAFERNVRFGHFHTYQVYTKTSAVDLNGHTGVAIPCLCKKAPMYGGKAPNKWMQGFCWGYVDETAGTFNDYVSVIVNGSFHAGGKTYHG